MSGSDSDAVPGVFSGTEERRGPVLVTLEVDGHRFAIRRAHSRNGTSYDWKTGPNEGYGFGSSGSPERPEVEHWANIRAFLGMIDPATGYIAED